MKDAISGGILILIFLKYNESIFFFSIRVVEDMFIIKNPLKNYKMKIKSKQAKIIKKLVPNLNRCPRCKRWWIVGTTLEEVKKSPCRKCILLWKHVFVSKYLKMQAVWKNTTSTLSTSQNLETAFFTKKIIDKIDDNVLKGLIKP